jgi:hypothetical protein
MEGVYSLTHVPSGMRVAWCSRVEPLAALASKLAPDYAGERESDEALNATLRRHRERFAAWGLT